MSQLRSAVDFLVDPNRYSPVYSFADHPVTDLTAGPSGELWFAGYNARTAKHLADGGRSSVAEPVVGELHLPDGASPEAPVPAMVILHGSEGDFSGRSGHLARKLAAVGVAGFAVDTFRSRGLRSEDNYFARLTKASIYTQIADGYHALAALQAHPSIQGDRIGVIGFSLGGASALQMQFEQLSASVLGEDGPRFAAHVGFYAGGNIDAEDFRTSGAPVLMTFGSADDSIDGVALREFAARLRATGVTVEVEEYEGAGHAWDQPEDLRFLPKQFHTRDCVTCWKRDGSVVEGRSGLSYDKPLALIRAFRKCGGKGFAIGRHYEANRRSVTDLVGFLDRVWDGDFASRLTDDVLSIGIEPTD